MSPTRAALAEGARVLAGTSSSARLDAELLLAQSLGVAREQLLGGVAEDLAAGEAWRPTYAQLLSRRRAGEPLAYLIGRRHFRDICLAVDPRALIPRPESELLVEWAHSLPAGARVLDLGTGSGALALAIKQERPDLDVSASDVTADALALARENALALGLTVSLMHADLLAGVGGRYDALICNPPYVATRDRAQLAPELSYEPAVALFGGEDGLAVIRRLVRELARRQDFAQVALEIGAGQAAAVGRLLSDAGYEVRACLRDLAGRERVLAAARSSGLGAGA
ncbi:MAG TPA: peptide chain release factor N(5)-glutamine methyltransferase [Solirubrobacteraceae bacterium]|nr:peptide chain release factor N(5)-glutamine methyltransferase [Solirubrobacteraceae bacterium]